jgi:hypothetical protein
MESLVRARIRLNAQIFTVRAREEGWPNRVCTEVAACVHEWQHVYVGGILMSTEPNLLVESVFW